MKILPVSGKKPLVIMTAGHTLTFNDQITEIAVCSTCMLITCDLRFLLQNIIKYNCYQTTLCIDKYSFKVMLTQIPKSGGENVIFGTIIVFITCLLYQNYIRRPKAAF
jgi:hypothetical protein